MACAEKLDHSRPKAAAHKLVYAGQPVFVLEITGFFWPILGSPGTHDFNRNGLFVRIQRKILAGLFHRAAFLPSRSMPSEPAREARPKWSSPSNGAALYGMRRTGHPCSATGPCFSPSQ